MIQTKIHTPNGMLQMHSDKAEKSGRGYVLTGESVSIEHEYGSTLFFRNGWNSWSPTGWRSLDDEPLRIYNNPERLLTADDAATDDAERHSGSAVGALDAGEGSVLLLGALDLGAPRVSADERVLSGEADVPIQWYVAWGPEERVFREYAQLVTDRLGRGRNSAGPVWSSWYSFFEAIDENKINNVLDDLNGYPFEVVQIDDGWERLVGDWVEGDGFPSGLGYMAERVTAAGFRPGLWVAPFICLPGSRVVAEHPEWLVQRPEGGPLVAGYNWDSHYYALDTTQPSVKRHIADMFHRFVAAGFTYFKLDFMYAGALEGSRLVERHRDFVYRDAIELIRAAVGEDSYLLGSGVPMLQSVGIFDGARVGPDVAPYWDNTERKRDPSGAGALNSLANSAARTWMRDWFEVDPDVVFFRSRLILLDTAARATLVDLALVTGFKSTSDPIAWLDVEERRQLHQFLSMTPQVERLSRWVYRIDDREVDFSRYLSGDRRDVESMIVK